MKTFCIELTNGTERSIHGSVYEETDFNLESSVYDVDSYSVVDAVDTIFSLLRGAGYNVDNHRMSYDVEEGVFILDIEQPLPKEVNRTDVMKAMGSLGIDMSPTRNSIAIVDLQNGDITVSPEGIDDMNQVVIEVKDV